MVVDTLTLDPWPLELDLRPIPEMVAVGVAVDVVVAVGVVTGDEVDGEEAEVGVVSGVDLPLVSGVEVGLVPCVCLFRPPAVLGKRFLSRNKPSSQAEHIERKSIVNATQLSKTAGQNTYNSEV